MFDVANIYPVGVFRGEGCKSTSGWGSVARMPFPSRVGHALWIVAEAVENAETV